MVYRSVKFIDYHENNKMKRWHLVSSRNMSYCKVVYSDTLSLSVHSRTADYFSDTFLKETCELQQNFRKYFPLQDTSLANVQAQVEL